MIAIQPKSIMTTEEAHAAESEIIKTGDQLRVLLVDFYERKGYRALGYSSYTEWGKAIAPRIFGMTFQRLAQELTAAVIGRELSTMVDNYEAIPERQLRPLSTFVERPRGPGADEKPIEVNGEAIRAAWDEANYRSGGSPTARVVAEVVDEMYADDELDPPMELEQVADQFPDELTDTDRELLETSTPYVPRINAGLFTKENKEWYTPQHIIDRVVRMLGSIDLDPCSNSHETPSIPAMHHYTADDNGLIRPWQIEGASTRVYMNPPYGDEIPQWVDRLVQAYEGEEIDAAIALLPARVDTNWFQPLWDYALCFVKGRLRFSGAENSAPFPSVVVYLGPDVELFRETFSDIGRCGVLQ